MMAYSHDDICVHGACSNTSVGCVYMTTGVCVVFADVLAWLVCVHDTMCAGNVCVARGMQGAAEAHTITVQAV